MNKEPGIGVGRETEKEGRYIHKERDFSDKRKGRCLSPHNVTLSLLWHGLPNEHG
jgi:hypothetical protein